MNIHTKEPGFEIAAIPMRSVGPVKIGAPFQAEIHIPLATFEKPLWPSVARGARISRACGGLHAVVRDERMTRSILLAAPDAAAAVDFEHDLQRRRAALVEAGTFRRDLYYRINVVRLQLPPLRERTDDIPLLVDHFIQRFNRLRGKDITGLSPEAMAALMGHDYPGNVRELEHIIEHAFVLCPGGQIEVSHLPEYLRPPVAAAPQVDSLEELEARFLLEALRRHDFNRQATAKALGIHKTTLWRKIRRLGLDLPPTDGRSRRK